MDTKDTDQPKGTPTGLLNAGSQSASADEPSPHNTPSQLTATDLQEPFETMETFADDWRRTKRDLISELERLRERVAQYEAGGQTYEASDQDEEIDDRQRAYTQLSAQRAFNDAVLESLDQGVITIDHNGHVTLMNRAARDLLGWGTGEWLGKPIHLLIHCDSHQYPHEQIARHDGETCPFTDHQRWQAHEIPRWPVLGAANPPGVVRREQDVFMRKDGSAIPVAYSISPIRLHKEITGLVIAFEDISEQRRIEQELRESNSRFQATFEAAAAGIALISLDGRFIQVNQRFSDMLGYSEEELLQHLAQDVIFGEDVAQATAVALRLQSGEETHIAHEKRYIRKDGTLLWTFGSVSLVRSPTGEPRYYISVVEDITARKQLEAELRASKQQESDHAAKLEATFETMSDGVLVYNAAGTIIHMNRAARQLYGVNEQPEFSGLTVEERVSRLHLRDDQGRAYHDGPAILRNLLAGHPLSGDQAIQLTMTALDGRFVRIQITGMPIRDEQGAISGAVLVVRDVTEQSRLQSRLHQTAESLGATNRRLDAFLLLAGQSLEEPLANVQRALRGLAVHAERYLRKERRSSARGSVEDGLRLRAYLRRAKREANQFERIFNELLDVGNIRNRCLTLRLAPCDLLTITRQVVKRLQTTHPLRDIRVVAPANRARLPILADSARVAQALTHYLRNALQFAPADRPITVTLGDESNAEGHWARVAVQDEGPGLTAERQRTVWDHAYRLGLDGGPQNITPQQRPGFGLYLCQTLIEWQRGQVGVESQPGNGATFWFALPLIGG